MAKEKSPSTYQSIVCCFQGGGALGAYQVGLLHALDEAGYDPHWFVGTSIGAINAAIAAGNPPKDRVEKMHQFWDTITTPAFFPQTVLPDDEVSRQMQHLVAANTALLCGQPHFFAPRFPPLLMGYYDKPDTISFYDTKPLKDTLEQFIDFDRVNSKYTRLSVGAVEICSGEMIYFDSIDRKIGPEHIMASGALPPGFPAVEIDDKYYWDGGLSSNSPATYVLATNNCPKNLLCFTVHLFDSFGLYPKTLDEVMTRKKDIEFSSRFTKVLKMYEYVHELKNNIYTLSQHIPKDKKSNQDIKRCIAQGHKSSVNVVRFLYEYDSTELSSKDYEFSKKSIQERIKAGYKDGKKAVKKSPWREPVSPIKGIILHDMSSRTYLNKPNK